MRPLLKYRNYLDANFPFCGKAFLPCNPLGKGVQGEKPIFGGKFRLSSFDILAKASKKYFHRIP